MDLDIRKNVISNFKGNTANEIIETIDTATTSKDELVLPGLGVLLELVWQNLNNAERTNFANILIEKINK